jgi:hypothetical protein
MWSFTKVKLAHLSEERHPPRGHRTGTLRGISTTNELRERVEELEKANLALKEKYNVGK